MEKEILCFAAIFLISWLNKEPEENDFDFYTNKYEIETKSDMMEWTKHLDTLCAAVLVSLPLGRISFLSFLIKHRRKLLLISY